MAFRDVIEIKVQAGKGGDGGLSFMRLKYIPRGGPDGGHGGDGGSIILEAIEDSTSLQRLLPLYLYRAGTGMQGEGRNRAGKQGDDLVLQVPAGTLAVDMDTGETVADLVTAGDRALVALGGKGGRGNASFATSTRRVPRFAEFGTPGEQRRLRLELRTIADVGLVGLPNAGKSSLLAALSNARPAIAAYPFTTLSPNLGVVERDLERLTMADIPGIIEDAHEGKGLGLEFLRHISRTRLLTFVVDIAEEPAETMELLRNELQHYDPELLERPALIVLNKTDLAAPEEVAEAETALTPFGLPVLAASALEGDGLDVLRAALFELLPEKPRPPEPTQTVKVVTPGIEVVRSMDGRGWVARGAELEAIVGRFDPNNREAVSYLHHHFRTLGLDRALRRAGASDGDDVHIGDVVFEYFDETAEGERRRQERAAEEAASAAAGDDWPAEDDWPEEDEAGAAGADEWPDDEAPDEDEHVREGERDQAGHA